MTQGRCRSEGLVEPILEPDLEIVDAHHHLFDLPGNRYMPQDYIADAGAGHRVVASVYVETQAFARRHGPDALRPLGEVEFANGVGAMTATGAGGPCKVALGIVGHADLTQGAQVGALLDRCIQAAPERFRGVRQMTLDYPDDRPFRHMMTARPRAGLLDHPGFAKGLDALRARGLVFDAAVFDPSLPTLAALVDRCEGLTMVLNHAGIAIGIDMSHAEKAAVFATWGANLRDLARRPNVLCKISGFGMPNWGFGFETRKDAVRSEELARAWKPYVETAVEAFGPDRCMIGSNFPPDRRSAGYVQVLNAYKIITKGMSDAEKAELFRDTAVRAYGLAL